MESIWIKVTICVIRILFFLIDILTYPFYYIIQKPWQQGYPTGYQRATQFSMSHNEVTYRSNGKKYYYKIDLCKEMEKSGVDTVEKMFNFVCTRHQNKPCIGSRQIYSVSEEEDSLLNGKRRKTYDMGMYHWITYEQVFKRALDFGKGVNELGYGGGTKVVIYAETRGKFCVHLN